MVLERLTTELAVRGGVLTLNDWTNLRGTSHPVGVAGGLTLSGRWGTHARCWRRYTRRLRTVVRVGDTAWGSGSLLLLLLLRERLRKLRWSLSLGCRRVSTRSWGVVKHLGRRREASVSWRGRTLRLILVLSGLLLGRGRLTRRYVLSKAISRVVGVQHLGLSTRVLRVLEVGKTVVTRPVCARKRLLRLSLTWRRSAPLRSRRASAQGTWLISLRRHVLRERCASLVG
jgi:hypothetical protein